MAWLRHLPVGHEAGVCGERDRQDGGEPWGLLALEYAVADRLVFSKLRQTFGGNLRFFISGGARCPRTSPSSSTQLIHI